MGNANKSCFGVVVPRSLIRRTKDALEAQGRLDKNNKIRPFSAQQCEIIDGQRSDCQKGLSFVPVTANGQREFERLADIVGLTGLQEHNASIFLAKVLTSIDDQGLDPRLKPFASTIARWAHQQLGIDRGSCSQLLNSYRWTYTVYQPLLLLPPSTLSQLLSVFREERNIDEVSSLYPLLCESFGVSHVALNAPIPEKVLASSKTANINLGKIYQNSGDDLCKNVPNIFRSPTGLTPLYGNFGPSLLPEQAPTADDFGAAFWCNAQQNGILQTWAPRYTMFSRGNISEKARLLGINSLTEERLQVDPQKISAVDLYSGIGYFAFSYAKAGIGKVLCWEINPWSVEGFMRGAVKNGWSAQNVSDDVFDDAPPAEDSRFLVFSESNEHAASRISRMRGSIPPVRHVNCGLLPTSRGSWDVAVQVLDPIEGGWIHAHENVAKEGIEIRKYEVVKIFMDLMTKHGRQLIDSQWKVECEHVEQVKSYAPGVIHCVFDIAIQPETSA